jgi:hypothetical protein
MAVGGALLVLLAPGCGDDGGDGGPGPQPTPEVDLVLNEFLAQNDTTAADEFGEFDDWIELLNAGPDAASTAGLYVTDDFTEPLRFALPDTTLPAGGHLLVWADGQPPQGRWHAPFGLAVAGEQVGLFQVAGGSPAAVDTLSFGPQATDVSMARQPDGGAWSPDPTPTPGAGNE